MRNTRVTELLIPINIILFGIDYVFINYLSQPSIFDKMQFQISMFLSGEYYRVFTAMFVHYSISHLACNMISLYYLGSMIEPIFGKLKFLLIYLISGVRRSVFCYVYDLNTNSQIPSGGASGAICGLLGAIVAMTFSKTYSQAFNMFYVVLMSVVMLAPGFLTPRISWQAHLGGFIAGIVVTAIMIFTISGKNNAKDRLRKGV